MNQKYLQKIIKDLSGQDKLVLYEQLLDDIVETQIRSEIHKGDLLATIEKYYWEAKEIEENPTRINGLSTRYVNLDGACGGISPEELIVLSGHTGQGKTTLAQNIAHRVAIDGDGVLFISLEMSPVEIISRLIRMHRSIDKEELSKYLPIYFYNGKSDMNLNLLGSLIEESLKQHKIKLVIIDHLHYFNRSIDNIAEETGLIVRKVKGLARDYKLPIILICHIRKTLNMKEMPSMLDLKDSSGIAQDADQVWMVWRNVDDPNYENILDLRVLKNRNKLKHGSCKFMFDNNYVLTGLK